MQEREERQMRARRCGGWQWGRRDRDAAGNGACRDARKEAESGEGENDGQKKRTPAVLESVCVILVGATGFEPATPWSQTRCATKLRHAPLWLTPPRKAA